MTKDTQKDNPPPVVREDPITRIYSDRLIIDKLPNTPPHGSFERILQGGTQEISMRHIFTTTRFQQATFNAETPVAEIEQLVKDGKGAVYIAADKDDPSSPIGYVVLQTENLDERPIQNELTTKVKNSTAVFHDHLDYPLPQETVLVSELGILPKHQQKGFGMELLQSVIEAYQAEHGGKYWTAFVRINNIGPIKINTRLQFRLKNNLLLGSMSAIGIQGPSNQTFGSHETNFRMDSIVPAIDKLPPDSASGIVWKNGDPKPAGANFFLPIPAGNQSDLASAQPMIDMLKMTMAYGRKPVMGEDFVMRKICDPEELSSFGVRGVHPDVPHLFFTKNWKFGFK